MPILPFLDVNVRYYPGDMVDPVFAKHDNLLAEFHLPSGPYVTDENIHYIVAQIKEALNRSGLEA